ncbi:MAG: ATP synthase F1 subunit delta [Bacteroidota bacterium]
MDHSRIAVRYAKAAFELAQEQDKTDVFIKDMRTLSDLLNTNNEIIGYLNNPVVRKSEKAKTIDRIFAKQFDKLSLDFIHLVVDHNRERQLKAICMKTESLYKELKGISSLEIKSAKVLDGNSRKKLSENIKSALGAKEIELKETVDESLIGGFVLRTEDLQYDASIKTQLARLKNKLKENSH